MANRKGKGGSVASRWEPAKHKRRERRNTASHKLELEPLPSVSRSKVRREGKVGMSKRI